MPESRGYAPSEFETATFVPGAKGMVWSKAADQLDPEECLLRRNLVQYQRGELQSRRGQLRQLTGLGSLHSIARMNLPSTNSFMRFWGDGGNWRRGNTQGTLAVLQAGFSGNPLTMLEYRPALTGDPWMIAADSAKMRQASATSAAIALGLAAPAAAVTAAIASILTTSIAAFDNSDGTQAASWTLTAGVDRSVPPNAAGAPVATDVGGVSGNAVEFTTAPGAAALGYSSIIGRAKNINLSVLQGGAVAASDDDLIHLWLNVDNPQLVEELRIYFVCSAGFDATIVPGTDPTFNTDAFVKAIRPHDTTSFLENTSSAVDAGELARDRALLDSFLAEGGTGLAPGTVRVIGGGGGAVTPSQVSGDASLPTQASVQLVPGRGVWSEFGNIDRPLRRGEFIRIGSTAGRGWDTITGIIIVIQTSVASAVAVACDDWFLTGGYPLDTTEPDSEPYDWRYTHYHTVTGDESNPSPIMSTTAMLEALRQAVNLTPVAYGDANVRQRFYRRGGTFSTDWGFCGTNTGDGVLFTDLYSDATIEAAGTLELDNDQPITTVNNAGTTVRAQPLPVLFGPLDGILFGLGDPFRPGHLYWSKSGRSGSWPPTNLTEVCSPSEELMTGVKLGNQGFLLSRRKGYTVTPNLVNGAVGVQESGCQVGICSRWAWCEGPGGIYFVSADEHAPGIYNTGGQAAQLLTDAISDIFEGNSVEITPTETLLPIDWTQANAIRLSIFQYNLYCIYKDTGGALRCLTLDLINKDLGFYEFAGQPQVAYAEPQNSTAPVFWLGTPSGDAHSYEGTSDNGTAIAPRVVTGYQDAGRPREDKNLGDVIFDADLATGVALSLVTRLNNGAVTNTTLPAAGLTGRRRYQADPFGTYPQRARNLQLDFSWSTTAFSALYVAGVAYTPLPDEVIKRASTWESFPTEQYTTGVSLDVDTNGEDVLLIIEGTLAGGQVTAIGSFTVNTANRARVQLSWPVQRADQLRIRPATPNCTWFLLYGYHWLKQAEPPRISKWDSNYENHRDTYYTGLDIECHTFGTTKQVEVWVDNVRLTDPATGLSYFSVTAQGRQLVHLTFGPGRGHIYRFNAIDSAPGLLYSHTWHLDEEPSEQTNWNQNYTLGGTLTNKAVKGVLIEADTFGQAKTVQVQLDGAVVTTLSVNMNGRLVQHFSFPSATGRVLRLLPTDNFPSRLYSVQWIYDEEPLGLQRWETQRVNHGFAGWQILYSAYVTLAAAADVSLTIEVYGQDGTLLTTLGPYTVTATGGAKAQRYVKFDAAKGVLFRYLFTSASAFLLYREESSVLLLPWGAAQAVTVKPFGSDDLDKVRQMGNASGIAGTPNNSPSPPIPAQVGLMGATDNADAS